MTEQDNGKEQTAKTIDSKELFGGSKLVLIEHDRSLYRLMITRQNKLILNK